MPPIRWGILGTGMIARIKARTLRALADAEIVAVGSRNQAASPQLRALQGALAHRAPMLSARAGGTDRARAAVSWKVSAMSKEPPRSDRSPLGVVLAQSRHGFLNVANQSKFHSQTFPERSAWPHLPSPFGDSKPTSVGVVGWHIAPGL